MAKEIINDLNSGTVHITEDVLISIVSVEVNNIEGVKMTATGMVERFSGMNLAHNVEVNLDETNVYVSLRISAEYGLNLIEVSENIQRRVKEKIETMTGLNVVEVNVIITDIIIPKDPKETNK